MKGTFKFIVVSLLCGVLRLTAAESHILLIAGNPSHGPGEHEHRAGCLLLQKCLNGVPGVKATVVTEGWPKDEAVLDTASTVIIYCDGGSGHPAIRQERLKRLAGLMDKGVGFGCLHYGVEVPKEQGGPEFLSWVGGYFEMHWSVNPHWDADFKTLPDHPITLGVHPFKLRDEWYYHMRFAEGMKGVTAILTALPPASTLERPDGPHSGNPEVRRAVAAGEAQHVMWAFDRANGGRGFGFTGGHFHKNWGNDDFRKVVLNAILWSAKVTVPVGGVQSTVTAEDLKENLDPKGK